MSKEIVQEIDINTDERKQLDWESRYPKEARKEIIFESIYISLVFLLSYALLIANYLGVISSFLALEKSCIIQFEYIVYFSSAGLLGGVVFGMKYFYRVIARGYWTKDRRYWRVFSPFVSMSIAFIVGTMASSGIITSHNSASFTWAVSFGFFAGYFADEAVGKMYEMATLLFGKNKIR